MYLHCRLKIVSSNFKDLVSNQAICFKGKVLFSLSESFSQIGQKVADILSKNFNCTNTLSSQFSRAVNYLFSKSLIIPRLHPETLVEIG